MMEKNTQTNTLAYVDLYNKQNKQCNINIYRKY